MDRIPATQVYANIEAYYNAFPEARLSPESDYGVWWKDDDGGNWRISYVHDNGHVIATYLGGTIIHSTSSPGGRMQGIWIAAGEPGKEGAVVILGRLEPARDIGWKSPPAAEAALSGWADKCGEQGSLSWVIDRVAQVSLPLSGEATQ